MSAADRKQVIAIVDEAAANGALLSSACETIGLSPRRLCNWRKKDADGRLGGYRPSGQELSEEEKDAIVREVTAPEMEHLPLKTIHVRLLDKGQYFGSYSTFRRVLKERNVARVLRARAPQTRKRPELLATGPNQVWCWDITWLESRIKGRYFYLYMIIDMYSRKVVGWDVYTRENGALARALFARTLEVEGVMADQIVVHADNGKPMRSRTLRKMFELLKVTPSHGRPHTSNDNAYAESLFATFKGRAAFPEYFATIDAARTFSSHFFSWYNTEHLHSGLDSVTPACVHEGRHKEIFNKRNTILAEHRRNHPKRHGGILKVYGIEETVRLKHRSMVQNNTIHENQIGHFA
jgi:putative transposase